MRFPPQVVMDVHTDGALVWVHNYHLLLLPSYLMRKVILARLGSALARHGTARHGTARLGTGSALRTSRRGTVRNCGLGYR